MPLPRPNHRARIRAAIQSGGRQPAMMPPPDIWRLPGESSSPSDQQRMAVSHPLFHASGKERPMDRYPSAPVATIVPDVLAPAAPRRAQPLAGRRVLVVTESLGPINGVTRATEQFLRYL